MKSPLIFADVSDQRGEFREHPYTCGGVGHPEVEERPWPSGVTPWDNVNMSGKPADVGDYIYIGDLTIDSYLVLGDCYGASQLGTLSVSPKFSSLEDALAASAGGDETAFVVGNVFAPSPDCPEAETLVCDEIRYVTVSVVDEK